jgi:hypothetical protein
MMSNIYNSRNIEQEKFFNYMKGGGEELVLLSPIIG